MNGIQDPVVPGEKKLKNRCLVFFVSIMYVFWNASFYVASILSETQLTVFNMKGCMEKMPKWILMLFSLFTCYTSKHKWICVSVYHKLLRSFFTSTHAKKQNKNNMLWCSENIPLWMSKNATWFSFLDNLPLLLHSTNTCPFRLILTVITFQHVYSQICLSRVAA